MKFKDILKEVKIRLDEDAYLSTILMNLDQNPSFSLNDIPPGPIFVDRRNKKLAEPRDIARQMTARSVSGLTSEKINALEKIIDARNKKADLSGATERFKTAMGNYKRRSATT